MLVMSSLQQEEKAALARRDKEEERQFLQVRDTVVMIYKSYVIAPSVLALRMMYTSDDVIVVLRLQVEAERLRELHQREVREKAAAAERVVVIKEQRVAQAWLLHCFLYPYHALTGRHCYGGD
jgi:hypothetical protein